MRLLQRHAPRVDVSEMIVATFPAEGTRRRPGFQDQVVALLEALTVVDRIGVRPPGLDAGSPHEAGEHAAVRDQVRHGELLGHPHRVVLDRQDVTEDQQLGPSRGTGEDTGRHVDAHVDARRGGVVLVDHQPVEAGPVGEFVLVEIALVVRAGLLRAEEPVRKLETERRILRALLVGELVMRHLAEVIELHGRRGPPRKSITRRANTSGCSIGGRWPQLSRTDSVALPSSRRYCSPQATGTTRSSRPQTMSAGFVTRGRKRSSRGLCMYGFQVSRADISWLRTAVSSSAAVGGRPNSASHSGIVAGSWTVRARSSAGG